MAFAFVASLISLFESEPTSHIRTTHQAAPGPFTIIHHSPVRQLAVVVVVVVVVCIIDT
jgi:hypothetical protein